MLKKLSGVSYVSSKISPNSDTVISAVSQESRKTGFCPSRIRSTSSFGMVSPSVLDLGCSEHPTAAISLASPEMVQAVYDWTVITALHKEFWRDTITLLVLWASSHGLKEFTPVVLSSMLVHLTHISSLHLIFRTLNLTFGIRSASRKGALSTSIASASRAHRYAKIR